MEFATIVDCDTDGENEGDRCLQDRGAAGSSSADEKTARARGHAASSSATGAFNGIKHQQNRRRLSVAKYLIVRRCVCRVLIVVFLVVAVVCTGIIIVLHLMSQKCDVCAVTPLGKVLGAIVEAPQGGYVEEYLGVPFAQPPVGQLRFANPVPLIRLPQEPFNATRMGHSCPQPIDTTFGDFPGSTMWNAPNTLSEDCLYLNVWVPHPRRERRSVMVWIFGGGFYSGSNALAVYDGKALAAHGDVIVVSINYRVGAFGFLTTGDGRIRGNFGFLDQVVALEWVAQNIGAFGGDPQSVTLFGESSGASSVGLHMMSPRSQHLFSRAIFESGSPDSHWAILGKELAVERWRRFRDRLRLQCNLDDDEKGDAMLRCLRDLPTQTILDNEAVDDRFLAFPWTPTVDGQIVLDHPRTLLRSGKFAPKDALLGVNGNEGSYWVLYALQGLSKDGPSLYNRSMLRDGVDVICWDANLPFRRRVVDLYSAGLANDNSFQAGYRDAVCDVCGDKSFVCPTLELNDALVQFGCKTWFYHLTYRASNECWPPWMGVIHGAEIQWIFGMPLHKSRDYTEKEKQLAKSIMSYWANFAKTGDPNGAGLPAWPTFTPNAKQYLDMEHPTKFSVKTSLRQRYCDFWKQ